MLVWIFQSGEPIQTDPDGFRSMRAINLSNELVKEGHEVVLFTSNFDHASKTHRFEGSNSINFGMNLRIEFIHSRGYQNNVSIARLLDHIELAKNLKKSLKKELTLPEVAFVGLPPLETAYVFSKFLKKKRIPFLVDVKDMWPDIFYREFPVKFQWIAKLIFKPYSVMLNKTLSLATGISTISEEFLIWCLKNSKRQRNAFDQISYLNSKKNQIDDEGKLAAEESLKSKGIVLDNSYFRVAFIGTLTDVFDFEPIIKAASKDNFQFVIAGNGPKLNELKNAAKNLENILVPGRITALEIDYILDKSDLYIIPLKDLEDFKSSLPNKFFDALNAGLPILTSSEGALKRVILEEGIGFFYDEVQGPNLLELLSNLDVAQLRQMQNKSLQLSRSKYSYEKNYNSLIRKIEQVAREK